MAPHQTCSTWEVRTHRFESGLKNALRLRLRLKSFIVDSSVKPSGSALTSTNVYKSPSRSCVTVCVWYSSHSFAAPTQVQSQPVGLELGLGRAVRTVRRSAEFTTHIPRNSAAALRVTSVCRRRNEWLNPGLPEQQWSRRTSAILLQARRLQYRTRRTSLYCPCSTNQPADHYSLTSLRVWYQPLN